MSATGKVIFAPLVKMSFAPEHRENFNSHFLGKHSLCKKRLKFNENRIYGNIPI